MTQATASCAQSPAHESKFTRPPHLRPMLRHHTCPTLRHTYPMGLAHTHMVGRCARTMSSGRRRRDGGRRRRCETRMNGRRRGRTLGGERVVRVPPGKKRWAIPALSSRRTPRSGPNRMLPIGNRPIQRTSQSWVGAAATVGDMSGESDRPRLPGY